MPHSAMSGIHKNYLKLPGKDHIALNVLFRKRKVVFQPLIFKGYVSFREGKLQGTITYPLPAGTFEAEDFPFPGPFPEGTVNFCHFLMILCLLRTVPVCSYKIIRDEILRHQALTKLRINFKKYRQTHLREEKPFLVSWNISTSKQELCHNTSN